MDTSSRRLRHRFAEAAAAERASLATELRRLGARHIVLSTSGEWLRSLAVQLRAGGSRGMTFASPELLLALLLVPIALVAYLLLQRRRTRYVVRFTNVALLENLVPRRPSWRRHVPTALYLAAIAALGIALARPSMVVPVPREEATVVLTMDTSRSMLATDVSPDRLTAAKAAASDFIASLPEGFRVALVAFSTEARLVMPPTTDRAQVQAALDALRADGGTALGDAIALSLEAADLATGTTGHPAGAARLAGPRRRRPGAQGRPPDPDGTAAEPPLVATVLLSDGKNSTGALEPLDAAGDAVARGVPVYTIALGTKDGIVDVPNGMGGTETIPVPPDTQTLSQIADMTGARFFEAPTSRGPGGDLREPRLPRRRHDAGAGGHPVVRRRGPAARPRRCRAGRLLVQPDPLTAPVRACRGARPPRGGSRHGATGRPETWDQWLPAARVRLPMLGGADTVGPRPRCCRTSHRKPASEDGRPRPVRRQRHEVRWQAVEPPFPRLGWPRIGPHAPIPVGGHALHRPREAGPGRQQHPRGRLGSREGHAASRAPRQHPQPPGPPRALVRAADHAGRTPTPGRST